MWGQDLITYLRIYKSWFIWIILAGLSWWGHLTSLYFTHPASWSKACLETRPAAHVRGSYLTTSDFLTFWGCCKRSKCMQDVSGCLRIIPPWHQWISDDLPYRLYQMRTFPPTTAILAWKWYYIAVLKTHGTSTSPMYSWEFEALFISNLKNPLDEFGGLFKEPNRYQQNHIKNWPSHFPIFPSFYSEKTQGTVLIQTSSPLILWHSTHTWLRLRLWRGLRCRRRRGNCRVARGLVTAPAGLGHLSWVGGQSRNVWRWEKPMGYVYDEIQANVYDVRSKVDMKLEKIQQQPRGSNIEPCTVIKFKTDLQNTCIQWYIYIFIYTHT